MTKDELNERLFWGVRFNSLHAVKKWLDTGASAKGWYGRASLLLALNNSAKEPANPEAGEIVVLLLKHGAKLHEIMFDAYYKLLQSRQLELLRTIKDMTPQKYFDDALFRVCEDCLASDKNFQNVDKDIVIFLLENGARVKPEHANVLNVLERGGVGLFGL